MTKAVLLNTETVALTLHL